MGGLTTCLAGEPYRPHPSGLSEHVICNMRAHLCHEPLGQDTRHVSRQIEIPQVPDVKFLVSRPTLVNWNNVKIFVVH